MKKREQTIKIGSISVPYRLIKRKRHYSYTLSVHAGGMVILTVPKRTSDMQIKRFIALKKQWLLEHVQKSSDSRGLSTINREEYKQHKEHARSLIRARLQELNKHYGYIYNRIAIRANTSRWGSCSTLGNLNFDYRIIFLPEHLQDYILVHELCHLRELNHSSRFWSLVAETIPHYRECRKALREHRFK